MFATSRPYWEAEALELAKRYAEPRVSALVAQALDPNNKTSHASYLPPTTLAFTPQDDRYYNEHEAMEEAKRIAEPGSVQRATNWRQWGGKMRGKVDIGKTAIAHGFRFCKRARCQDFEVKSLLEYVKFGTTTHWQAYFDKKNTFEKKKRSLADAYRPRVANPEPHTTWRGSDIIKKDLRLAKQSVTFPNMAWQRMLSRATDVKKEGAQAIQRARHAIRLINRLFNIDTDEKVKNQKEYEYLMREFGMLPWMRDVTQPLQPQRDGVAVNMADVVKSPTALLTFAESIVLRARFGLCMEKDGKTNKPVLDYATIGTRGHKDVGLMFRDPIPAERVRQIETEALTKLEITLVPPTALADNLTALCEKLYRGKGYCVPQPPSWQTLHKDIGVEDISDSEIDGIEEESLGDLFAQELEASLLAKQARLQQDTVLDDDSDWETVFDLRFDS